MILSRFCLCFCAAAAGFLTLPATPARSETPAIPWRSDLATAMREAAQLDRLVWIQFTGSWCPNCVRMDREAFADARVSGRAASDFVPVKLRADEHEQLALSFGLSALPATVIVKPDGRFLTGIQGFVAANGFDQFLANSLKQDGRAPSLAAAPVAIASKPVAMGGYCPVSLVDRHRLVRGVPGFVAEHEGQTFLLASESARASFLKNPHLYVPMQGARCPVTRVDRGESAEGQPKFGVLYDGHLYLCASAADRKRFLKQPQRYAYSDVADRGFCPHCWASDGLIVRGWPDAAANVQGRRYFFCDPDHLVSFRERLDRVAR